MAAVESQMLAIGTKAPEFSLPDPDDQVHALRDGADAYLVMFICNHCPYVKHVREELARLGEDYTSRNVAIYGINSNDTDKYPGDSPENMKQEAQTWGYTFPYLIDTDQSVAQAYRAACTPDFYLFDAARLLVYRGQLDGSRPSNDIPVDGRPTKHDITDEMRRACESILPAIVESTLELIAKFDPEYQDIIRQNIILAGGGSQIRGLDEYLENVLSEYGPAKVHIVDDPLFSGADGALALAQDMPAEYWTDV